MIILWLINYHNLEHDQTTCMHAYDAITLYCFSVQGLHFSALVTAVTISVQIHDLIVGLTQQYMSVHHNYYIQVAVLAPLALLLLLEPHLVIEHFN